MHDYACPSCSQGSPGALLPVNQRELTLSRRVAVTQSDGERHTVVVDTQPNLFSALPTRSGAVAS